MVNIMVNFILGDQQVTDYKWLNEGASLTEALGMHQTLQYHNFKVTSLEKENLERANTEAQRVQATTLSLR
jgi:hypothetical protein